MFDERCFGLEPNGQTLFGRKIVNISQAEFLSNVLEKTSTRFSSCQRQIMFEEQFVVMWPNGQKLCMAEKL